MRYTINSNFKLKISLRVRPIVCATLHGIARRRLLSKAVSKMREVSKLFGNHGDVRNYLHGGAIYYVMFSLSWQLVKTNLIINCSS